MRVGMGYDVHRLTEDRDLILGGVKIPWEKGDVYKRQDWSPTVRPPRLGGNTRKGVFATRSPFRPNPIGLSSVKLEGVEFTSQGPVLHVSGADLMDGTPIYDIKPYLALSLIHIYIEQWSIGLDIKILFKTVTVVFTGSGAK